jgi:hypothetical protein
MKKNKRNKERIFVAKLLYRFLLAGVLSGEDLLVSPARRSLKKKKVRPDLMRINSPSTDSGMNNVADFQTHSTFAVLLADGINNDGQQAGDPLVVASSSGEHPSCSAPPSSCVPIVSVPSVSGKEADCTKFCAEDREINRIKIMLISVFPI